MSSTSDWLLSLLTFTFFTPLHFYSLAWGFLAQDSNLPNLVQDSFHRGKSVCAAFDGVVPQPDVGKTAVYQQTGNDLEAHVGELFLSRQQ